MQDKVTRCLGLVTQYNPLTIAPGALLRANDCFIRRENVIEDRRGYLNYATLGSNINQFAIYQNRIIAHRGSTLSYDDGSGTFADYSGSYSAISGRKVHHAEAFSNLFVTTNGGIQVFSDVSGAAGRLAGSPRSLDPSYTLTGSTGFLDDTKQCAYRSVIVITDSNGNTIRGFPSQRLWVTNAAGGGRNVIITNYLPSEVTAGYVIEFYRTEQVSGTTTDTSGDEMGLVFQYEVTSTDVTNGYVQFTDSVTDTLIGASLYTNPSQEGISQANDRPPLSKDIALYKSNFMLYANTQTKQRLFNTLVGTSKLGFATTGDTDGSTSLTNVANVANLQVGWKVEGTDIAAGTTISALPGGSTVTLSQSATGTTVGGDVSFYTDETITLGGVAYSFGSSEIVSGAGSPQVQVGTTGVAAADIDSTARSMIRVINRYASNTTIYAYYLTGPDDLPGQFMCEEKGIGASAFTFQSSDTDVSDMFFPPPPVSPSTSVKCTSSNDVRKNAVYFSKVQQPEHVPQLNFLLVGPSNKEILRVIALKDSAVIIKEEGIYRITGEDPQSFTVIEDDLTVFCKALNSVSVLANQVFMLSNQGVVSISSSNGVQVISREIEPNVNPLLTVDGIETLTYGCGSESERSYFLSTITDILSTVPDQTLVYNIFTKTWVRHTYAFAAAIVEPAEDKLFYVSPSNAVIKKERKSFTSDDLIDPEHSVTITSVDGLTVEFMLSTAVPDEGWVIEQANTQISISSVTAITGGYRAVMKNTPPDNWTAGAATIYPSVGMDIEWHSWTGQGNPDLLKQVHMVGFLADDTPGVNSVSSLTATFRTNFDPETEDVPMTQPGDGWGGAWGAMAWGGTPDSAGYPTWVPRNKQYCTRMNVGILHKNARERLAITGIVYSFRVASDRMGR